MNPRCPHWRGRTRFAHGVRFGLVAFVLLCACAESTPEGPTPPPEPPATREPSGPEVPGLNPAPFEDTCDPPAPTTPGQGEAVWGVPEQVETRFGDDAIRPQLAVGGGRVYLAFQVGTIPVQDPAPEELSDIYITHREGAGWSDPMNISNTPPASTDAHLTVDGAGVAHMLWGEWIDDGTGRQRLLGPTSIFYSTNGGGAWSEPDSAWYATDKNLGTSWRPVLDASGRVHMVVDPAIGAEDTLHSQSRFFHRVRSGGAWSPTHPIYIGNDPDLAIDSLGSLLVVYTMGDARGGGSNHDVNSVFFTRSEDGGVTWSRPQRIVRGGEFPAYGARITIDGRGRIHVLWVRDTARDADRSADAIEHSYSLDGVCWSAPIEVTPSVSGWPGPLEVVPDDGGGLHVAFNLDAGGFGVGPFRAIYVYWDGTAWHEPIRLYDSDRVGWRVGLARDAGGTLHLALWADLASGGGLYYATGRPAGGP